MGLENVARLKRDRRFLIREEVKGEKSYQREAKTYFKSEGFQGTGSNGTKKEGQATKPIYKGK